MIIQILISLCICNNATDQQWEFSVWLEENNQTELAYTEYQRFALLYPDDPRAAQGWLRAGCLQESLGKYHLAQFSFSEIVNDTTYGKLASYELHKLSQWYGLDPPADIRNISQNASIYLRATGELIDNDPFEALVILSELKDNDDIFWRIYEENKATILMMVNYPTKNPWEYGLLSTAIPGLGQYLLGRKTDGLHALELVGVFGITSYFAAKDDRDATAMGLGITAGLFHLGNIYGAASTAKGINIETKERTAEEVFHILETNIKEQELWCPCCP